MNNNTIKALHTEAEVIIATGKELHELLNSGNFHQFDTLVATLRNTCDWLDYVSQDVRKFNDNK